MEKQSIFDTIKSAIGRIFTPAPFVKTEKDDSQADLQTSVKTPLNDHITSASLNSAREKQHESEPEPGLTVNQLIIDQLHTNPLSIRTIMNPSEEMQYAATSGNARALNFIEYPTENVVVTTISQAPEVVNYLDKIPSDDLLIKILNINQDVFKYIKGPSDELVYEALSIDGNLIRYIENPSVEFQIQAIKTDPSAIMHIKNPTEALQVEAVKRNRNVIEHIQNPVPDIPGKSGWIVYSPESSFGFTGLPDRLKVQLSQEPNYHDYPIYTTLEINITDEIKATLLTDGHADLGFDDSPRFDISGGYQAIVLNADGSMDFRQRVTAVEGGSVNYYDQTVPVHVDNCKFTELKRDLNRSQGLSR